VRFQEQVFEGQLGRDDLRTIKELIRRELALERVEQVSFEGFVALQKKCIELLKIQTCWTVLRHFGYDDSLALREEPQEDAEIAATPRGESLELSAEAVKFLTKEFFRHARHEVLPLDRLPLVFYAQDAEVLPDPHKSIQMKSKDCLEVEEWLLLWHLLQFEDAPGAFRALRYLGFQGSFAEACHATNAKDSLRGLQQTVRRTVLSAAILGHRQSEFTWALNCFGIALGTYRRRVIVKHSGSLGCRLFVLREVPEDEWLPFFHSQYNQFDLLVFTANRPEDLAVYAPYLDTRVPRVGMLVLSAPAPCREDLLVFKLDPRDFLEQVAACLARPEACLAPAALEAARRQPPASTLARVALLLGLPLLLSALFLFKKIYK
jgi:hypothetical protein